LKEVDPSYSIFDSSIKQKLVEERKVKGKRLRLPMRRSWSTWLIEIGTYSFLAKKDTHRDHSFGQHDILRCFIRNERLGFGVYLTVMMNRAADTLEHDINHH
jgi:hypothetical protein